MHDRASSLTYDECKEIVENAPEPKPRRSRKQ